MSSPELIDHIELKTYGAGSSSHGTKTRVRFVHDLLSEAGSKWRGEDVTKYVRKCKHDFDVMADMSCRPQTSEKCSLRRTRGYKDVSGNDLANAQHDGLKGGRKKVDKAEVGYIMHMLDEISSRLPDKKPNEHAHKLLLELDDQVFDLEFLQRDDAELKTKITAVRFRVDFIENPAADLTKATEEYLKDPKGECETYRGRRLAYDSFIPYELIPRDGAFDIKSIPYVVNHIANSKYATGCKSGKKLRVAFTQDGWWQTKVLLKGDPAVFSEAVEKQIAKFAGKTLGS